MRVTELPSLSLWNCLRILSSLFLYALNLNILFYPFEVWSAVRMKDLGRWSGAEELRLIGYGLVVGLEGTGDSPKSLFTHQSLANMLLRFGIAVDRDKVKSTNVAAVMVTAEVPPFRRKGDRFDVIVSLLGDAKSLQGGVLLQTTLSDMEGKVWGLASGPLSIGGFNVEAGNVSVRQNYAAVGRVPNGGVLSVDLSYPIAQLQGLEFILYDGDFTTVHRLVEAINSTMGSSFASARDKNTIHIQPPFA
ncbi:MAG: flagellar basal body P-ring protein FlgI, partial [bacterium]